MKCIHCSIELIIDLNKRGPNKSKYCSKRCKLNHRVILVRRRIKIRSVVYLGGKCYFCGYSKCLRALHFHHRDPKQKKFGIANPNIKAWKTIQEELDKCDLLCANCHAEQEDFLLSSSKTSIASHC